MRYFLRVATLFSQTLNTVFLFGNPDETVSARCYRLRNRKGWGMAYRTFNKIFFWQKDHCHESFLDDVKNAEEVQKWKNNQSF